MRLFKDIFVIFSHSLCAWVSDFNTSYNRVTGRRLSSVANVTVNIVDVNDEQPRFTTDDDKRRLVAEVGETSPVGTKILVLEATDGDRSGVNKWVSSPARLCCPFTPYDYVYVRVFLSDCVCVEFGCFCCVFQ